jgi:hypothetical protein
MLKGNVLLGSLVPRRTRCVRRERVTGEGDSREGEGGLRSSYYYVVSSF